jgi:hypothetical protein
MRIIGPPFEQMGRKTVAQRMQRHRLLDAGRVSRLVKQTIELPGCHRLSWLAARDSAALAARPYRRESIALSTIAAADRAFLAIA